MTGLPAGLVAIGGDLSPERLIDHYRRGIFPWYEDGQPVLWWCPDPRIVFDRCEVHISRSLKRTLDRGVFHCTLDTAFERVIDGCAAPREGARGTWITADMRDAYCELHRRGIAHSLEVWNGDALAGGVYGVALGRMFFGESMFSVETDASKVGLVTLARTLRERRFTMIDAQLPNAHLERMGAVMIPREVFLGRLESEAAPPDRKLINDGA